MCECGAEVSGLFDENFYNEPDTSYKILVCPKCKNRLKVSKKTAIDFYQNKIFACFNAAHGNVLEIGCGDGLLTKSLIKNKLITKITAIDIIDGQNIADPKVDFIQFDLNKIEEFNPPMVYDFAVCRDVLMYLDNIETLVANLAKYCKNLIFLNWYQPSHKNCLNKTSPETIAKLVKKYYNSVQLSYPEFYRWGYLLTAQNA